jgi:hypothetical protein
MVNTYLYVLHRIFFNLMCDILLSNSYLVGLTDIFYPTFKFNLDDMLNKLKPVFRNDKTDI